MEFTYGAYAQLLRSVEDAGYAFTDYHSWQDAGHPCIIRHDVDFDMRKARAFSDFEHSVMPHMKSTYFVLLNTDFYNLFSADSRKSLDQILLNGHEIGLHFDETKYDARENIARLTEAIREELDFLSAITGNTITTVSMHRPSKAMLEADLDIPGAINAYRHEYFKDFKYYSDSRMHWREDVESGVTSGSFERLHILTHPFWYGATSESIRDKIRRFIGEAADERTAQLKENIRDFNDLHL